VRAQISHGVKSKGKENTMSTAAEEPTYNSPIPCYDAMLQYCKTACSVYFESHTRSRPTSTVFYV